MKSVIINPREDITFDLKVREMCKSCKRYGYKAMCPPYVGSIDYYERLLCSFSVGEIYYDSFKADIKNWKRVSKDTSLNIHNRLLQRRKELQDRGCVFIVGFGAGSCKLCETCSFPCRNPDKAMIPLEGTGINVVKLMNTKAGIDISFPIVDTFYRVGAIFYDE